MPQRLATPNRPIPCCKSLQSRATACDLHPEPDDFSPQFAYARLDSVVPSVYRGETQQQLRIRWQDPEGNTRILTVALMHGHQQAGRSHHVVLQFCEGGVSLAIEAADRKQSMSITHWHAAINRVMTGFPDRRLETLKCAMTQK